ncbi:SMI1/KNR4 family protein [Streptomyces sp. NPDC093586]|uniref:SMI1/KNR4 family protein n=1 Tax=Streptomyces sp. NPDC093586 TaxID=3366042 RepID=UPI0038024399
MNNDRVDPAELAALRAAFVDDDGRAPALGPEAVRAFEAEHGIVLPEPYRTFVAQIADGSRQGPPAHGLLGPGELPAGWGGDPSARDLSEPFPPTEPWLREEDEESDEPEEDRDAVIDRVLHHGSVVLGTDGCAMDGHLVVTGPHRGRIWRVTDVGALPFGAASGRTTAESGFVGWVRHWADGKEWFDAEAA